MFNVGSEDKEKLRENMEEIKDLIQNRGDDGETSSSIADRSTPDNAGFDETDISDSTQKDSPTGNTGFGQETEENSFERDNTDDFGRDNITHHNRNEPNMNQTPAQQSRVENARNTIQQNTDVNQQVNNQSQNQSQRNNGIQQTEQTQTGNPLQQSRESNNQREESTTQNNASVTDSSRRGGSQKLFLEVERFEKVKNMIQEMQELTSEIEETSGDLESQIDRERESENQAQQLLDNFSDRKNQVEDVVLDSEEN